MVRIVNGEIVDDDRSAQAASSRPAPSGPRQLGQQQAAAAPEQQEQWWQRPPLRLRHDVPPMYGVSVPDVEIFGLHVTAQQLLIAAALALFFGWRMLVFLAILFMVFKVNSSPLAPRPAAAGTSGDGSGLNQGAEFLRDYMASNPRQSGGGGGAGAPAKDSWSARGKGQKLGSAGSQL